MCDSGGRVQPGYAHPSADPTLYGADTADAFRHRTPCGSSDPSRTFEDRLLHRGARSGGGELEDQFVLVDPALLRQLGDDLVRHLHHGHEVQSPRVRLPDFGTVIQGIFTGQLDDPQAALKDLQDRSDRALDEAIDAANAEGAEMSRDDWVFGNWDPTRHYAQADYDAL